jgi:hypothetical protein
MHIYLVEPDHPINYPNLALMKISTQHKRQGDTVQYIKGIPNPDAEYQQPNIIYISTLFTYYSKKIIDCINYYKNNYPKSKIVVGGIFATLMPEYLEQKTGIKPFVGHSKELDALPPDYSLVPIFTSYSPKIKKWADFSMLFSTRGCPNQCGFCAVNMLEPDYHIIENWREAIDLSKSCVMFQDNNLTSFPFDHFINVMEFVRQHKLKACFNNGFDARKLTDDQIDLMARIKWIRSGLRLAFDNMSQDGYVQRAIEKLIKKGVSRDKFMIFCLYNYTDTFDEAMYRCSEMRKLGVRPFPEVYYPLDKLDKKRYVSPQWTYVQISDFLGYWFMMGNYKKKTWEEFVAEQKKLNRKRRIPKSQASVSFE